jgi:hypothetical protein
MRKTSFARQWGKDYPPIGGRSVHHFLEPIGGGPRRRIFVLCNANVKSKAASIVSGSGSSDVL